MWMIAYVHTIVDYGMNVRHFGIIRTFFLTLLSMLQWRSNRLKMVYITASHTSTIWGLYFLRSTFPCLELLRYLQAGVFLSKLSSFSIFLVFVIHLAIFWQRPFFHALSMTFVIYFIASFYWSAALYCFHGVQIISVNISQMINKNKFFHYDQSFVTSMNY